MDKETRRIIWSMSDEDSDVLLSITRRHIKAVLEQCNPNSLPEHKQILKMEIQALIAQRDALIEKYRQNEKGEIKNHANN